MQIGSKIIHLDSVDSTNNYVANLIKSGEIASGTVILADDQYAGKGQRGAEWLAKPGKNLTLSFFLDNVNLSVERQFILTQLVSLSLIDLLEKYSLEAEIKWPNDIYVRNKKIAGVLIENQIRGTQVASTIIGIGLNVNQSAFGNFNATSFNLLLGKEFDVTELLYTFVECFNSRLPLLVFQQFELLEKAYLENLYLRGLESEFEDQDGKFKGTITGVTTSGKLIVDGADGVAEYDLKELKFIF